MSRNQCSERRSRLSKHYDWLHTSISYLRVFFPLFSVLVSIWACMHVHTSARVGKHSRLLEESVLLIRADRYLSLLLPSQTKLETQSETPVKLITFSKYQHKSTCMFVLVHIDLTQSDESIRFARALSKQRLSSALITALWTKNKRAGCRPSTGGGPLGKTKAGIISLSVIAGDLPAVCLLKAHVQQLVAL